MPFLFNINSEHWIDYYCDLMWFLISKYLRKKSIHNKKIFLKSNICVRLYVCQCGIFSILDGRQQLLITYDIHNLIDSNWVKYKKKILFFRPILNDFLPVPVSITRYRKPNIDKHHSFESNRLNHLTVVVHMFKFKQMEYWMSPSAECGLFSHRQNWLEMYLIFTSSPIHSRQFIIMNPANFIPNSNISHFYNPKL